MQMEKEKQSYDFENVQSQLDKALGQATRMQKERETIQLEADRLRDKHEKAQVIAFELLNYYKIKSSMKIKTARVGVIFMLVYKGVQTPPCRSLSELLTFFPFVAVRTRH